MTPAPARRHLTWALAAALLGCTATTPVGDVVSTQRDRPAFDAQQLDVLNLEVLWESPLKDKRICGLWLIEEFLLAETEDHLLYGINVDDGVVRWIVTIGDAISFTPYLYRYPQEVEGAPKRYDEFFVISRDRLMAIDADIGAMQWRMALPFSPSGPASASQSKVFVPSWDDRVYALDKETQVESWHYITGNDITAATVVPLSGSQRDVLVFVGSEDGRIYALDANQGRLRWQFDTARSVKADLHYYKTNLYVGSTDYNLYALSGIDGSLTSTTRLGAPVLRPIASFPNEVYAVAEGEHLYAVHRRTEEGKHYKGDVKWKFPLGIQVLAQGRERLYVLDHERAVVALDLGNGRPVWKYPFRGVGFFVTNSNDPAAIRKEERDRGGTIYLGFESGWLIALKEKLKY